MENQETTTPIEQSALRMSEPSADISADDLQVLGADEDCRDMCRALEDTAATPFATIDVDGELRHFHRAHSSHGRLVWGMALVAAAAVCLSIFLLKPTTSVIPSRSTKDFTVFKATPQAGRSALQLPASHESIALSGREGRYPASVADVADGRLVYAPVAASQAEAAGQAVATHRVAIPRGETYQVILSDGTQVWLNTDTRLTYPEVFNGVERTVYLEGEAYFKVAKDSRRPFIVKSKAMETKVLGTEFNFRSYPDEPEQVVLVEGSVEVSSHGSSPSVRMKPGQCAQADERGKVSLRETDVEPYTYWKDGLFYFDNCSLESILKEIGRWYNVDVELRSHRQASINLHFVADRHKSLAYTIQLLNQMEKVKARMVGGRLIVE